MLNSHTINSRIYAHKKQYTILKVVITPATLTKIANIPNILLAFLNNAFLFFIRFTLTKSINKTTTSKINNSTLYPSHFFL